MQKFFIKSFVKLHQTDSWKHSCRNSCNLLRVKVKPSLCGRQRKLPTGIQLLQFSREISMQGHLSIFILFNKNKTTVWPSARSRFTRWINEYPKKVDWFVISMSNPSHPARYTWLAATFWHWGYSLAQTAVITRALNTLHPRTRLSFSFGPKTNTICTNGQEASVCLPVSDSGFEPDLD